MSRIVQPGYFTAAEFAVLLGRHKRTIIAWANAGKIPGARRDPSGQFLIPMDAVRAFPLAAKEE